ncbi:GNAT family N-acetyltransferase [Streptomyces avicenniae]|uniref:GNAT family N-acetyltransferase n=1 Tax=Streptomyces avicenniae TaxID=500153 RepID=UPI00069C22DF|nr:GNAT family N-acetyltransferase [Streptomyces avicenniae]
MEPVAIEAGSIRLRPFRSDDIDWLHQVSADPLLRRFIDLPSPYRREDAAHFVERLAVDGWTDGSRAEFLVESAERPGRRLGRVGLHIRQNGTAEIGFWADPSARGAGVTTAAVRVVCRWAFTGLGLALVEWRAEVGNDASRRVAEKAGFLVEAVLRRRLVHRGERVDAWVGSLLPCELLT